MRPRQWYAAGARLIGGCCGTGPEDIRGIATALGR
ncbi:MAG TPA: homocysteine S-methyltransferase family protein [Actinomycetota bacterium]|nr:homocysteine S-methyltransferase family protein [Actinomycetota bacterium]